MPEGERQAEEGCELVDHSSPSFTAHVGAKMCLGKRETEWELQRDAENGLVRSGDGTNSSQLVRRMSIQVSAFFTRCERRLVFALLPGASQPSNSRIAAYEDHITAVASIDARSNRAQSSLCGVQMSIDGRNRRCGLVQRARLSIQAAKIVTVEKRQRAAREALGCVKHVNRHATGPSLLLW